MSWETPKTDWVATDHINYTDLNRIGNNLAWLREEAVKMYREFEVREFTPFSGYTADVFASQINLLEENLETINTNTYDFDIGATQTYVANQPTINYVELNRIESACLQLKTYLESQYAALRRLSFRLGSQKGIKV